MKKWLLSVLIFIYFSTNTIIATSPPVFFGIYSNQHPNSSLIFDRNVALYLWNTNGRLGKKQNNNSLIGDFMRFEYNNKDTWNGFGYAILPRRTYKDMSRFSTGSLVVSLKASGPIPDIFKIGIKSGETRDEESWIYNLKAYGFRSDGKWHTINIPIQDFIDANPNYFEISQVSQYFMLAVEGITTSNMIDYDEIYWTSN